MRENLMEEKQLDFNQPLLSVRRFSPKMVSRIDKKKKTSNSSVRSPHFPAYKSDLKSGPVSHPGTVPFIWEKSPGRPKNEDRLPTLGADKPPLTPTLPPGRGLKVKQQDSDQVSKGSAISYPQNVASYKSKPKKMILREAMQETLSSDSDDGDDAYQDALDTLSTTESFFMNCSLSGLSGFDDQEVHPCGSSSRDQQARNFMIGRFLPAAKAIASGSPQYNPKKPTFAQEDLRWVKEVVRRQRYSPHRQIVLSHYAQDIGKGETENEDDNESIGFENNATKICGLFPRLCFLNPLPELRMEDRVLSSAAHGMQTKSSIFHTGARKEHAITTYRDRRSVDSQFAVREEKLKNGIDPYRRGCSKLSACECTQCDFGCASPVVEKTLYVDSVHKVKSHQSSSSVMKGHTNHRQDCFETSSKDRRNCKKPSVEPKSSESLDLPFTCCPDRCSNDMKMDITNHSRKIQLEKQGVKKPLENEIDFDQNSAISSPKVALCKKSPLENLVISDVEVDLKSLLATHSADQECSKVVKERKIDLENQCLKRPGNQENSDAINLSLPLVLPQPKAPSESWLKRTLPTVSSNNISLQSYAAAKIHARSRSPNTAAHDPKLGKIVKFSEELLTPIPED